MTRIAMLATVLFCLLSAAAQAATATGTRVRVEEDGVVYYVLQVRFEAGSGEANDVTVTVSDEQVVFDDAGAPIDGEGDCANTDTNRVVCSSTGAAVSMRPVLLGDRRDQIRVENDAYGGIEVRGGPGDDQLYGGSDNDHLFAGPGDDVVDGGPGGDTIDGGGGRDELRGGEHANPYGTDIIHDGENDRSADSDTVVGTASQTLLTYRARREPVSVDLAAGIAGAKGERDTLVGITMVAGGKGDDTLLGSHSDDFIVGEAGADVVRGRGGDDLLRGASGPDRIYGGGGDDKADEDSDDALDIQSCGRGSDFVSSSDKRDRLRRNCEDGGWSSLPDVGEVNRITAQPTLTGRRAIFKSTCHEDPRCKGRIRLVAPATRELLGSGRFRFRRYRGNDRDAAPRHDIVAELNDQGLERLRRGGYVRVVIVSRWDCRGCLNPPPPARTGFTTWMKR